MFQYLIWSAFQMPKFFYELRLGQVIDCGGRSSVRRTSAGDKQMLRFHALVGMQLTSYFKTEGCTHAMTKESKWLVHPVRQFSCHDVHQWLHRSEWLLMQARATAWNLQGAHFNLMGEKIRP